MNKTKEQPEANIVSRDIIIVTLTLSVCILLFAWVNETIRYKDMMEVNDRDSTLKVKNAIDDVTSIYVLANYAKYEYDKAENGELRSYAKAVSDFGNNTLMYLSTNTSDSAYADMVNRLMHTKVNHFTRIR